MWKKLWESSLVRFIREIVSLYFGKNVSRASAELAYFLILSFFPILICINAFIGLLQVNVNYILGALEPFLPPSFLGVVSEYLRYITVNESPALLAAGLAMTMFSSSAAMRSLMNVMDEVYEKRSFNSGFWQIVASVIFSLLLLVTIYLSLAVVLTGRWFFRVLEEYLPFQLGLGDGGNWQYWRFFLLFGMVLILILLVYWMSAPRGKPRPPLFGGALMAAVALVGASILFSWFIGMSSRYSLVYGSLTSVVIMLLWLYLCGNILILGNVFNAVRYQHKVARHKEKEALREAQGLPQEEKIGLFRRGWTKIKALSEKKTKKNEKTS